MLTNRLAAAIATTFAKHCKSLRGVQRPADRRSPAAARAGGLLCAKNLLQNFYDPNSAGGCGVAPFPSRIRFRLRSVASSLGRGCTNAKKATGSGLMITRLLWGVLWRLVTWWFSPAFRQAISGLYLDFKVVVFSAALVNCAAWLLVPTLG